MKAAPFAYHAPKSKEEALGLLARYEAEDARIIAGGQSLVPMMAFRLARPGHLIDINRIPGLGRIEVTPDTIVIGALARHAAFERPVDNGPTGLLLAEVARAIGHAPIRSRGTFGGSLANADPASEWCMSAVVLNAVLVLESPRARREVAASDFFQGIMTTALGADELLTEIRLPRLAPRTRFGFFEASRRQGDFALAAALALFQVEQGRIQAPRLALAGVEPHSRRLLAIEEMLEGAFPDDALWLDAAKAAAAKIEPLTDGQVDADLRRRLAETALLRALRKAALQPSAS